MEFDINKLHGVLLEIMDEIFKVCEENDLTCFLSYGTALGAYRHHGFIPWDDDADLEMPRDDYEKFIEIMKNRKDSQFVLQNEDTEENYFLDFIKIRKKGTLFIENSTENRYKENGIFIDIFPLDFADDIKSPAFKLRRTKVKYLSHITKFAACPDIFKKNESKLKYLVDCVVCLPGRLLNTRFLLDRLNYTMKGGKSMERGKYAIQFDDSYHRQLFLTSCFFPTRNLEFEGRLYPAPGNIRKYLKRCYGADYMTLPPVEERRTHEPLKIEY